MTSNQNPRSGLEALLTPEECGLMNFQPFQFAGTRK
jgi:hypothetical protein